MTRFVTGVEGNLYHSGKSDALKEYRKQYDVVKDLFNKFRDSQKRSLKTRSIDYNKDKVDEALTLKSQLVKENKKLISKFNKINNKHGIFKKPRLTKNNKLIYRDQLGLTFNKLQLKIENYANNYNPMLKKEFDAHKQELLLRHDGNKQRLTTQKQSLLNRLERLDKIHNFKGKKSYIKPMTDEDYANAVEFAKKSLKIVEEKLATV